MKKELLTDRWMRMAGLALVLSALVMMAIAMPPGLRASEDNAVANGDFDSNTTGWTLSLIHI